MIAVAVRVEREIVVFVCDNLALLFKVGVLFGAETTEFDDLDAGRAKGVRPVSGTFGVRNTTGYLVEEVGRGNGAVERGD